MTILNLLLDPLVERFPDNCGANICDPLLGSFGQLNLWLWQISINICMVLVKIFSDILYAQPLVSISIEKYLQNRSMKKPFDLSYLLRDVDSPDHCSSEHFLFSIHELFQKVDGDVIVRR